MMKRLAALTLKALFAGVVLPVLYLLEPFVRFRFGLLYNQRIGHLSVNTDVFLRKQQVFGRRPRTFHIFFLWDPANQTLADMFKRRMTIVQNRHAVRIYYTILPILERTRFHESLKDE